MSASSLASKVQQTLSTLQSSTRQMKADVEAVKKNWSGSSYDNFRASYCELEKKFSTLNSSWRNVASRLNSLSGAVEAAERDKKAKLAAAKSKNK